MKRSSRELNFLLEKIILYVLGLGTGFLIGHVIFEAILKW